MGFKKCISLFLIIIFLGCSSFQKENSIFRQLAESNDLCPDINMPTLPKISDDEFYKNYKVCCKDDLQTPTVLNAYIIL